MIFEECKKFRALFKGINEILEITPDVI